MFVVTSLSTPRRYSPFFHSSLSCHDFAYLPWITCTLVVTWFIWSSSYFDLTRSVSFFLFRHGILSLISRSMCSNAYLYRRGPRNDVIFDLVIMSDSKDYDDNIVLSCFSRSKHFQRSWIQCVVVKLMSCSCTSCFAYSGLLNRTLGHSIITSFFTFTYPIVVYATLFTRKIIEPLE